MTTINISLPDKLKEQGEELIEKGFYASFSDLVRDSLRKVIDGNIYDAWAEEAKKDLRRGKASVLKTQKDIDAYIEVL